MKAWGADRGGRAYYVVEDVDFEEVKLIGELHDPPLMVERSEVELAELERDGEDGDLVIHRIEVGLPQVIVVHVLYCADEVVVRDAEVGEPQVGYLHSSDYDQVVVVGEHTEERRRSVG